MYRGGDGLNKQGTHRHDGYAIHTSGESKDQMTMEKHSRERKTKAAHCDFDALASLVLLLPLCEGTHSEEPAGGPDLHRSNHEWCVSSIT